MKTLVLLMLSSAVFAQTKTTKPTPKTMPTRPATLSGRVFLITKSGDLKPARMALVYLFFMNTMPKRGETESEAASRHLQDGHTAGGEWAKQSADAWEANATFAHDQLTKWKEDGYHPSSESIDKVECTHTLVTTLQALNKAVEWAEANQKASQALRTTTDEEGNFAFTISRPGVWEVYAYGHAGFNDAFWGGTLKSSLIVEAGAAYTLKLSSPETACLVME
jgi:hypothetical protein